MLPSLWPAPETAHCQNHPVCRQSHWSDGQGVGAIRAEAGPTLQLCHSPHLRLPRSWSLVGLIRQLLD